ncbi:MAG TPA: TonB family protein [Pyrinomonadaceae bacterium]|jgi:TonB family protein
MKKLIITSFAYFIFALVFTGAANAQSGSPTDSTKKQETDRPLKITRSASPSRDTFSKCFKKQATGQLFIRLRAIFHSSGKITGAEIVTPSGCEYFDKESLGVVQKIKFKPEIKNGEAVTVTKIVEFKAGVY